MILAAVTVGSLAWVRHVVGKMLAEIPQSEHHSWKDVRMLKVSQVRDMLKLRLTSTWALTSWVYFNRIRQMGYELILSLPEAGVT